MIHCNQHQTISIKSLKLRSSWLLICFLLCHLTGFSQKHYQLKIQNDQDTLVRTKLFYDSLSASLFASEELNSLITEGHLEASFDKKLVLSDSSAMFFLHIGPKYKWAKLNWNISDPIFQKPANWDQKITSKTISVKDLQKRKRNLLNDATNRGYPFASVFFSDIKIINQEFQASLNAEKGPFIIMDDITVEGEKIVSDNRIWNYVLDLKQGKPFIANKITQIDERINELPFVETTSPSQIIFKEDQASIKLFLKKKKANHFDIILGLQPTSGANPSQSRTILTGQITADMYNMLSGGERIFFDYRRFNVEDQNVQLGLTWPFLLGTKVGADGQFQLQKRDTTHLDIQYGVGLKIPLKHRSSIKIFIQENISNLLSINKTAIQNSIKLPSLLDFKRSSFGLEGSITSLDFIINPTSGWDFKIKAMAGLRTIKKNQKIIALSRTGVDFNALYDSAGIKSGQFRFDFQLDRYTRIFKKQILKTSLQSGSILFSENTLRNELYRIGGYKLLRGFDEQSLEVSKYLLASVEYRYLLGPLSYAFIFSDFAFTNTNYDNINFNDQPLSFGFGMTLQTKAGLFGVVAAVGQRTGLAFDFRAPKIHFGYISVF